jgi:FlaA1/EpsC-like NDP-sugar epimerase
MIALSGRTLRDGHNPDGDIEIQYTGLRPGEKLYEELLIGENVAGTDHPMIMQAAEHAPAWDAVQALLGDMHRALLAFDCDRVRKLLGQAVQEYRPASQMHDLVWSVKNGHAGVPEPQPERRAADTVVRLLRPAPRTDI